MRKQLFLIRGLPGSGKTTLANLIEEGLEAAAYTVFKVATDNYFEDPFGNYDFDPTKLTEAHAWCQTAAELAMRDNYNAVIVHNTFSQPWEADAYFALADRYGYQVFVIETQNKFPNIHGVPQRSIDGMRARWLPLT